LLTFMISNQRSLNMSLLHSLHSRKLFFLALALVAVVPDVGAQEPDPQPCTGVVVVNSTDPIWFSDSANCDPIAEPKRGQIIIPKMDGICQLRVDFREFQVGNADPVGNCGDDRFTITGAANLKPKLDLCGTAESHVYLHYDLSDIEIETRLETCGSYLNILLTPIHCGSTDAAPYGCTQYFNCSEGEVRSFNFPNQQLNSQRYTVCVQAGGKSVQWSGCARPRPPGTTTTTWGTTTVDPFPEPFIPYDNFFISGLMPNFSVSGDACKTDYIVIPPDNKICGNSFPAASVHSSVTPAVLYVNFDESEFPIISDLIDPVTGCPVGFECSSPVFPCPSSATCVAPPWYFTEGLIDIENIGFCLNYSVV